MNTSEKADQCLNTRPTGFVIVRIPGIGKLWFETGLDRFCIFRFDGQVTVFQPNVGPCYRCLYPEPPPPGMAPSCAEAGVLGILPGIIGVAQAIETIKVILGIGQPLVGRLLTFDALQMSFKPLKIRRDPECPLCGDNPTVTELIDYEHFCSLSEL